MATGPGSTRNTLPWYLSHHDSVLTPQIEDETGGLGDGRRRSLFRISSHGDDISNFAKCGYVDLHVLEVTGLHIPGYRDSGERGGLAIY